VLFKSNAAILISRFHVAKDIDDCYFELWQTTPTCRPNCD